MYVEWLKSMHSDTWVSGAAMKSIAIILILRIASNTICIGNSQLNLAKF